MRFEIMDNRIMRFGKDGADQLTNFTATINRELIYHDAAKTTTHLEISGLLAPRDGEDEATPLPPIVIPAQDFADMTWVAKYWGMAPAIYPAPSAHRDASHVIQINSRPTKHHVYTHTGWTTVAGRKTYLSKSGGITTDGLDASITVELPPELSRYVLPPPTPNQSAFHASMALRQLGPFEITWPLILAAYRASYGDADFSLHVSGRTGTFKSEVTSLIQSHFGPDFDARHNPATWSSTGNAIEALAYRAKDAIMVVDDFVPIGTSYQVRSLQATADRLFRAQGNRGGRSRLTEVSAMQTTMYPRGIILSSGEDIPEGHSMRGRMFIIELTPESIRKDQLTIAQAKRSLYSAAMADWIHWLAAHPDKSLTKLSHAIRDAHIGIGHARTPQQIGDLCATANLLGVYATERHYMTDSQAEAMIDEATKAVVDAAERQHSYQEQSDPVQAFIETIRTITTSLMAHCKTRLGGIPVDAERYGWTKEQVPGQLPTYRANGPQIGWIDTETGEFLFDPNHVPLIKKHSGGRLAITPQTLAKRIKEAGMLSRVDDTRQRNTVRVQIEGHPRQLMAFRLDDIFDDAQ